MSRPDRRHSGPGSEARRFLLCTLLTLLGLACSSHKEEQSQTDLVTFPLRGLVVGKDSSARTIVIAHEAIPSYMPAMTMPFRVKDASAFSSVTDGDSVGATLVVSRTESWLEGITRLRPGAPYRALSVDEVARYLLRPGDLLPDMPLVDQDGRSRHLSDFRGKALALTFIYTRCPLPDFCIRMSDNFAKMETLLKADRSLDGSWHLLSISFDPGFDRPAVLKQYAATYGADLADWTFATDPDTAGRALERLADGVGLSYRPEQGIIEHTLRTLIIDRNGALVSVTNGNGWSAEEMADLLRQAAR